MLRCVFFLQTFSAVSPREMVAFPRYLLAYSSPLFWSPAGLVQFQFFSIHS